MFDSPAPSSSPAPSISSASTPISPAHAVSSQVFLGRQPIFDTRKRVQAYELLYRSGTANAAVFSDDVGATKTVLQNALCDFGLNRIAGDKDVLVNFPACTLETGLPEVLPPERAIVEILEDVEPTEESIAAFKRLKAAGCRLAMDDVVFEPRLAPLLKLADVIKVDLRMTPEESLFSHVSQMRSIAPKSVLLAEKVETGEEYDRCVRMGFDLFQGYFFCKPQIMEGQALTPDRTRTLQLLAALQDDALGLQDAADLIASDPTLSVKLLNYINSAAVGLSREVESIKRAAALVGRNKLRMWATLIGLSGMSNKPRELILTANVRGRMCELIGEACYGDRSGAFFTLGLFSLLDAFTDTKLDELLNRLPLSPELISGILNADGKFGDTLKAVRAWEAGTFEDGAIDAELLQQSYSEAVGWAAETVDSLFT